MSARNKGKGRRGVPGQGGDDLAVATPGLRHLVTKRFLVDVLEAASTKFSGWKVLVVDDHAMRIISSVVGMYDIMERRITLVESIDKKRAPFPDMGAVYILEPSMESVQKLLADFNGKGLYGEAIFLYFLGRLPDDALENIKNCRPLRKKLKGLSEINIDFLAKEERSFLLDEPMAFTRAYNRGSGPSLELLLAQKLVTVCATLNEFPYIRHKATSPRAIALAENFNRLMNEFVQQNPSWWYNGGPNKNQSSQRERGTLLILDRADDCLTPLLHDFHYASMVHDVLDMDGDKLTYESESETKDVVLDVKDELWMSIKHQHLTKVIQTLSSQIRDMSNSSAGKFAKADKQKGNMSIAEMNAAMNAMPEYKQIMTKLAQHMHFAHKCMGIVGEGLVDLSELEQTLATGCDDEGTAANLDDLVQATVNCMYKMNDVKDRLRLLLIFTISQGGIRDQDKPTLMNAAMLQSTEVRTLNALETLGVHLVASQEEKKGGLFGFGGTKAKGAGHDEDAEFSSSRYVPPLKTILEDLAYNTLSLEDYPSIIPMPELTPIVRRGGDSRKNTEVSTVRKNKGVTDRWAKSSGQDKKKGDDMSFSGGRHVVFFCGGLSYAELRVAHEVMEASSREIVMGSSEWIAPKEFMNELEKLGN